MSYVVKVVGYNCYWTGDTTPGKLWNNNLSEAQVFEKELDAINIVYTGRNMEVVEYKSASSLIEPLPPDYTKLDQEEELQRKIEQRKKPAKGFKKEVTEKNIITTDLTPEDFEEVIISND